MYCQKESQSLDTVKRPHSEKSVPASPPAVQDPAQLLCTLLGLNDLNHGHTSEEPKPPIPEVQRPAFEAEHPLLPRLKVERMRILHG